MADACDEHGKRSHRAYRTYSEVSGYTQAAASDTSSAQSQLLYCAAHLPGAIECPAVVLQAVARVDAPQIDCQCLKHPSGQNHQLLSSALTEAAVELHGQNHSRLPMRAS